ncbi:MinD/ParA family protein [Clostridium sp. D2Q-11]|uniref:MinD/ParA family protein n=1 Tax=Anaeromonas frigoriresistens TaxID=2683708 RepID=A0A942UXF1_9FIRM|nr:MinD/ParA family protein [Anaeromonas frigoriresistens]MBS4539865.1 MinD/ParA family protein [Anaeromonas frigoriresistens]
MRDQAEKLRQLIVNRKKNNESIDNKSVSNTRVLTVTSGKGGVGKTNFTINLSLSLCKLGYKVAILDADIGFANIDVILGIMPKYSLIDVIRENKDILDIMENGPYGLKIIPGGSGLEDIMHMETNELEILTNQLMKLEESMDFIIIDTGAGVSKAVINFVSSSDEIILVTTPEPTSLTDGYAMLKVINNHVKKDNVKLVVNRVQNERESIEVYNKLNRATIKFLNLELENLGYIYESKLVTNSVKNQLPFVLSDSKSPISRMINTIALRLIDKENVATHNGLRGFLSNIKNLVNRGGD